MSNTALLVTGYVLVTLLYGAYWASLRIRVRRLERLLAGGKR